MPPALDRPLIGLTASSGGQARLYAEALERSGGEPRVILPGDPGSAEPGAVLRGVGALVLSGGVDINPRLYGQDPDADAGLETDDQRDVVELPLLRHALGLDMPTLCICRGMQLLNVALDGRLIQDIAGHSDRQQGGQWVSSHHHIYISPGSKLAAVVGSGGLVRVNSRHHQGVGEAQKSPDLLASAYSVQDGVIEAVESPSHRWVIGVQFHPERRGEVPPHFERLFQALADRASERTNVTRSARIDP